MIAATRLARSNVRVVVVESGHRQPDTLIDTLDAIDNPVANYPAIVNRRRGLGGTSLLWAGKLLPLSRSDTGPRPYLNLAGWPFEVSELAKYSKEIETLMGVDHGSYEEDVSDQLEPRFRLGRNEEDFALRWPKRPTLENHNLAHVLRHEIEGRDNPEIWLGATVAKFDCDPASGRVTSLCAINHDGQTLNVAAVHFVIAAGALESTRLLLLADRQMNGLITRDGDSLGRYFNDHLGLNVATLHPTHWAATNRALSDRLLFSAERHLHFELRHETQQSNEIGSAYFDIGVTLPETSRFSRLKTRVNALKGGNLTLAAPDLLSAVQETPGLFRYAYWKHLRKQRYWHPSVDLQIKVWVEQLPFHQNRISLSDLTDNLGLPRLRLDWTRTDVEETTFQVMVQKIDCYWKRRLASICGLRWNPVVTKGGSRLVDAAYDLAHPAGSTRMGTSPATSVVNSDLIVHRIPNLSVASSSVFPSSGSANPTLTIMQMALRAADALTKRMGLEKA